MRAIPVPCGDRILSQIILNSPVRQPRTVSTESQPIHQSAIYLDTSCGTNVRAILAAARRLDYNSSGSSYYGHVTDKFAYVDYFAVPTARAQDDRRAAFVRLRADSERPRARG